MAVMPATVGFRLDATHNKLLFERATALKMSPHELARIYVVQMLHEGNERRDIYQAIQATFNQLTESRKDTALVAQELLISSGIDEKNAKTWVKENLLSKC